MNSKIKVFNGLKEKKWKQSKKRKKNQILKEWNRENLFLVVYLFIFAIFFG